MLKSGFDKGCTSIADNKTHTALTILHTYKPNREILIVNDTNEQIYST